VTHFSQVPNGSLVRFISSGRVWRKVDDVSVEAPDLSEHYTFTYPEMLRTTAVEVLTSPGDVLQGGTDS